METCQTGFTSSQRRPNRKTSSHCSKRTPHASARRLRTTTAMTLSTMTKFRTTTSNQVTTLRNKKSSRAKVSNERLSIYRR